MPLLRKWLRKWFYFLNKSELEKSGSLNWRALGRLCVINSRHLSVIRPDLWPWHADSQASWRSSSCDPFPRGRNQGSCPAVGSKQWTHRKGLVWKESPEPTAKDCVFLVLTLPQHYLVIFWDDQLSVIYNWFTFDFFFQVYLNANLTFTSSIFGNWSIRQQLSNAAFSLLVERTRLLLLFIRLTTDKEDCETVCCFRRIKTLDLNCYISP